MLTRHQQQQRNAAAMMLGDALTGVPFDVLCAMFLEHLSHRADLEADKLEETANAMSRMAWEKQRRSS